MIDDNGVNLGVLEKSEALEIAYSKNLDLVIVSRNENSVVARITDLAKFKYEKSKKSKKNKGKSNQNKEIWFRANIQERDLLMKLEKAKEFISKGSMVKLTLKGEKKVSYLMMREVMDKIVLNIIDFAKPINSIANEGRNLSITIKALK